MASNRAITTFRLRPEALVWQEVGGEVVAMATDSGQSMAVNRAGAVLWQALARGSEHGDLVQSLSATFRVSRAQAERDVDAFLAALRGRGLLVE